MRSCVLEVPTDAPLTEDHAHKYFRDVVAGIEYCTCTLVAVFLTRVWANAQRDGRPAEYRWRPLFNDRKDWLTPNTGMPCSNAAKTGLKLVRTCLLRAISTCRDSYLDMLEAGRRQVRTSFEPVCDQLRTCFEPASNQIA